MNKLTTSTAVPTRALKLEAMANISASFELFCLASGMEALGEMMDRDAQAICGPRHARGHFRRAHRWGKTKGKIGFHGGNVEIERPRLRSFEGKEQALPSWEAAVAEDWLRKWAMNQMLINVSTRRFARSGSAARGRRSGAYGVWSVEIGCFPPLRGAVGGAHEGVGSVRPLRMTATPRPYRSKGGCPACPGRRPFTLARRRTNDASLAF